MGLGTEGLMQTSKCGAFILYLLKQVGRPYRLGAETVPGRTPPRETDCSELVQEGGRTATLTYVGDCPIEQYDGAWKQWESARDIPLNVARETIGALLFIQNRGRYDRPMGIGHVGVVIAPGYVLHASSSRGRVVIDRIGSAWNLAAKIDELYEAES